MRNLRKRRLELGLTQALVAALSKQTTPQICNYERGWSIPRPAAAKRIADVLGLDPDKLLEEVENELG